MTRARVNGAITVVNAIPAGRGAAMGVDLWTEASVELTDDGIDVAAEGPDGPVDDELVRTVAKTMLPDERGATIRVESTIPVGRGLKSSSAAANATALALSAELGRGRDVLGAVRAGVEAARRAGVTTTGAFDDATASAIGGVCVTDNREDRFLARHRAPDLAAAIAVPDERKSDRSWEPDAYGEKRPFGIAHTWAHDGSWQAAMSLNATGVVDGLGLDPEPILDALAAGAVAAGPSGTGPAVAALAPERSIDGVADALTAAGDVLRVEPTGEGVRWG